MYLHLWQSWILFCTNFYSPHPGGKQAQKMPCGEPGKQESGPFCIFLAIFPGKWVMRFVCRVPPPPPRGAGRFGWCSWQRWIQIHSLFFILFWARIKPGHPRASCVASSLPRLPSSSITQSYRRIKKIKKKKSLYLPLSSAFFANSLLFLAEEWMTERSVKASKLHELPVPFFSFENLSYILFYFFWFSPPLRLFRTK